MNALVTGLGPTERVVVYDNLLELPDEQIAAVVAHEIAHAEHADLPRGVALAAAVLLAAFVALQLVLRPSGPASGGRGPAAGRPAHGRASCSPPWPSLELLGTPVGNLVSRRAEAAADARAVELTRDPGRPARHDARLHRPRPAHTRSRPVASTAALRLASDRDGERIDYLEGWARRRAAPAVARGLREAETHQRHPAIDGTLPDPPAGARP